MKRPPEKITNDRGKRKCMDNFECASPYGAPLEEGELGLIESVTVQNFMCHENVTLKFGSHMNFLIGQNGSGKSAILTAIILALGGRSSTTDRHTNIKGFVKTGKNKAKIEVVLRNRGDLPYKPETYGEKIVVIREFTKDGVSSYKIKSETGTICSTSKKELTNILEAMDIMVECPVCVLTQATSKNFLISKELSAEKLFQFFYKGTGLELLESKYKTMDDSKESAEAELNRKKQSIPILKKELKKWYRYLESSQKISDYKNELIWANVIAMEKAVQQKEEEHKKIEEEFKEHKRTLEGCKKSFSEKSLELDELHRQKTGLDIEMEKYRKKLEELKAEHETHSSSYRRNKGTIQKLGNDKKKLKEDIMGLEKCINEQKRKDQRNLEEEDRKRQEAIQILKEENFNLEEKLKTLRETINTKRNEQTNIEKALENFRAESHQYAYECSSIQDNLVATQNAVRNKVNAFGEHTEKVLWEIKRMQGRFRKTPVGPIGIYLEVKDPKWAAAVEFATTGNLLNSFCVDNHQDSLLLRDILKIYPRPPAIIVSQFEPQMYDIQHGKVQSSFPSVLDMLKINNHLVANCLIDQAQIEKKILVEDEKEDTGLMNNPPRNCQSAYFKNCDQICFHPSRMYSFGNRKASARLSAIRAEDVKNLEKELEEKKAKIKEVNRKIETMVEAKKSLPGKMERLELEVVKISTESKKKLMEIRELQRSEEKRDVDCLEEDLQTLHHSYEQKIKEIEQYSQVFSDSESKKLDLEGQINTLSSELKSLNEEYHRLHIKLSEVSKLKENFATGKRKYELELRCKENEYETNQNLLKDMQSKLESTLSRAESTCERIHTERSSEEISRRIKETERVVEAQSNCQRENLIEKYKEKSKNLQRAETELSRLEKLLTRIGEMIKRRNAQFIKVRKNTELLINLTFTTILGGNGYSGYLQFGQESKTLTMEVSTRDSDKTSKKHSSLSGGERSFVTIAFLLALWERTKMPFRILDEYDVFMDSSNRQLSIDLLCKKAGEMSKSQFILLSPLELTRLPPFDYIQILRMAPPKRKVDDENSPRKKRS